MNEKTKKILRYVACGLGGLALGIGLLGGLAMCASSGNRSTTESVNTILTTKKNAGITTEGGFSGYQFSVNCTLENAEYNHYRYAVYDIYPNYTLTLNTEVTGTLEGDTYNYNRGMINTAYTTANAVNSGYNKFLYYEAYSAIYTGSPKYIYYFSFVPKTGNDSSPLECFICKFGTNYATLKLAEWANAYSTASSPLFLTITKASSFFSFASMQTSFVFQDVESYYSELGYQDGYEDGYETGESAGYSSGYADGYETGESAGYSSGYAEGFRTGYMNTYYAFTSLTANLNKVWNMAEIPWHRNTDILVTQDNFDDFPFFDIAHLQVGIYINWAYLALFRDTVTLTPYYVYAQRYTTSQNDGYNVCINIAPASQDTIQEDGNIGGTTGPYLLQEDSLFQLSHTTVWTAPNRCRLIGFMEDTEDIYTNWFDDGYLIPQGIEVDTNAYEEGYRQGQHDATNDTDIQNVFSLLTPAFTAVGGFFNLKVFGFLPLYWFFLAPLFVALITLILRMVKH